MPPLCPGLFRAVGKCAHPSHSGWSGVVRGECGLGGQQLWASWCEPRKETDLPGHGQRSPQTSWLSRVFFLAWKDGVQMCFLRVVGLPRKGTEGHMPSSFSKYAGHVSHSLTLGESEILDSRSSSLRGQYPSPSNQRSEEGAFSVPPYSSPALPKSQGIVTYKICFQPHLILFFLALYSAELSTYAS